MIHEGQILNQHQCAELIAAPRHSKLANVTGGFAPNIRLVEQGEVAVDWLHPIIKSYIDDVLAIPFGLSEPRMFKTVFLKYSTGFFYKAHQDVIPNLPYRRVVSISIGLDSGYTGGELVFYEQGLSANITHTHVSSVGTAIAFNSDAWHEVRPVTSGVRHAVVVWVSIPTVKNEITNLV